MKVSDYVAEYIVKLGVKDIFLISGGGMMHLLDSVAKNNDLNLVCNLNEQASSICADSYAQYTNNIGVCMLTTGPGGTNAVTGIAASYLDSVPVLAISGQCKTADFASLRNVRQFGAQEVDIVSIVKPITKYAVKITNKEEVRYHLEKAIYLAKTGRKGPVWLDIPLDIQAAQIEPEKLEGFNPPKQDLSMIKEDLDPAISRIYELLMHSKRPVLLIGGGVVSAEAQEEIKRLVKKLHIPVLATWRAKDVFAEDDLLYFGAPGIPTTRYSNYVLQNSDLLIIIGTRLNPVLTAYDEPHFGLQAKKVIIDIDENEINKLNMEFIEKVCTDARLFISKMLERCDEYSLPDYTTWINFCQQMKQKYPLLEEKQPVDNEGLTDGYYFMNKLSEYCDEKDVIIGASSGRACGISHMAFELKEGQRFMASLGLGSMGFVVPAAIGGCLASGKRRTIALEGDGSLQHNIQELQLIKNYDLPIKLFILSNSGYASIYMMQKNNFKSQFAACDAQTYVSFPKVEDIAKTYELNYYCIENNEDVERVLSKVMGDTRPILCEIKASIYFDEIPKSMTVAHPNGTFSSSKLENLYPFLSEEELRENMPQWENDK